MEPLGLESRKLWEQDSTWPLSESQTQGGEVVDRDRRPLGKC